MQKLFFLMVCSFTLMHGMEGKFNIYVPKKKFDKNVHTFEEKEGEGEVTYVPHEHIIVATFKKDDIITILTKKLQDNTYETHTQYSDKDNKKETPAIDPEITDITPAIDPEITDILENKILAHEYYLKLR